MKHRSTELISVHANTYGMECALILGYEHFIALIRKQ